MVCLHGKFQRAQIDNQLPMFGILSDIHANLEALEAVLAHARSRGVSEFVCLGDVVGYGPNPRECLEIARKEFRLTLRGNHEQGVVLGAMGFSHRARQALDWTRDQLKSPAAPAESTEALWQFLRKLPEHKVEEDRLFVHGSPLDPVSHYVFPADLGNSDLMDRMFKQVPGLAFCGHTHQPGIFLEAKRYVTPEEIGGVWERDGQRALVNVGSVGQPRDGDNRACYVVVHDRRIEYHRVPYDFARTHAKIVQSPGLPVSLADRLEQGL